MIEKSKEILQLQKENIELKAKLEIKNKLVFIFDESIPEEAGKRRAYVSSVAGFYGTLFEKKIKHFIGLQMEELAQIGRTELSTNIIRANINCLRIIDEWMLKMTNEHLGDLNKIRDSYPE